MPRFLREKKGRKSLSRSSAGMPRAAVGDLQNQALAAALGADLDLAGRLGRLERVVEQVDEHAPELLRIDPDLADAPARAAVRMATPGLTSR